MMSQTHKPSLYYEKVGSGPALVLIHGFPENGTLWRHIKDGLAQSYTLIIPDLPGSGQSPLMGELSISDMGTMVKEVLDAEHITHAVIAGHSMGGYVALAMAASCPGLIAGLSMVHSTPMPDDEERKTIRRKAIEIIDNGGKGPFVSQMVANLFSPSFKQSAPGAVNEQVAEGHKLSAPALVGYYKAMMARPGTLHVLENAAFPVQWIIGKEDNVIYYRKILEICNKSGINFVCIYEDCGHMSMIEDPERLASDLLNFCNYCYDRPNNE